MPVLIREPSYISPFVSCELEQFWDQPVVRTKETYAEAFRKKGCREIFSKIIGGDDFFQLGRGRRICIRKVFTEAGPICTR